MMTWGIDGEAFLIGDEEQVTWRDFYRPIAEALGFDLDEVPQAEPRYTEARENHFESIRASAPAQALLSLFPFKLRLAAFHALTTFMSPTPDPSLCLSPASPRPQATLEMSLLYRCRYKLPSDKAVRMLSYRPIVSFAEACRRTVAWLDFAGYPVLEAYHYSILGTSGRKR
jgi:nucleoside-diphosphate-sugar epimerase